MTIETTEQAGDALREAHSHLFGPLMSNITDALVALDELKRRAPMLVPAALYAALETAEREMIPARLKLDIALVEATEAAGE